MGQKHSKLTYDADADADEAVKQLPNYCTHSHNMEIPKYFLF
jgi:hypothetical protein